MFKQLFTPQNKRILKQLILMLLTGNIINQKTPKTILWNSLEVSALALQITDFPLIFFTFWHLLCWIVLKIPLIWHLSIIK